MSDHVVLYVDRLMNRTPSSSSSSSSATEEGEKADADREQVAKNPDVGSSSSSANEGGDSSAEIGKEKEVEVEGDSEEDPLIQAAECRICQEEDSVSNLENPCGCSGSLKQPRPVSCSSCESNGHVECKWCRGTGFFILGDNMLCQVPSRNTTCVICAGKGSTCCSDCKGTGFRAKWLGEPPIAK